MLRLIASVNFNYKHYVVYILYFSLIDKKINMLMPEPFETHHDSFLENYLNTLEPRILNSDRLVVARHKTGYGINFFQNLIITKN